MFLFSGTFFPLVHLPARDPGDRAVRRRSTSASCSCRDLTLGTPGSECIVAVVYLLAMGLVGKYVAGRRIATLLLK